jgi:uncharacterized membrane protein/WD40 repeat protein
MIVRKKNVITVVIIILLSMPQVFTLDPDPRLVKVKSLDSTISAIDISKDGGIIALGHFDGVIRLLNNNLEIKWEDQTFWDIRSVAVSWNSQYLAYTSGSELAYYKGENPLWKKELGFVKDISISNNGMLIAAATPDGVHLIDKSGNILKTFKTSSIVESVDVSSDGALLAIGDQNSLHLYDTKRVLWSFNLHDRINDVGISHYGGYLAAGTEGGHLYFFSTEGELLWVNDLGMPVSSVDLSKYGGYLVAGGQNGVHLVNHDGESIWAHDTPVVPFVVVPMRGDKFVSVFESKVSIYDIPDVQPLEITIESPLDKSILSDIVKIEVGKSRSAKINLLIDGKTFTTGSALEVDTRLLSNGKHSLTVVAKDFLGNGVTDSVDIFVDNGAIDIPPVKILGLKDGDIVSRNVRINAWINIPYEEVSLFIDDEEISRTLPYTWNTYDFKNGLHEIRVAASRFGKVYDDRIKVILENDPGKKPLVRIFSPLPESEIKGTKAIRAVFATPPSEVYVKIDEEIVSNFLPYVWNTSSISEGSHTVTVLALDEEGNLGHDEVMVYKPLTYDSDEDGWRNELERLYQTDPHNRDTDGDGILDSVDEDPLKDQSLFYNYIYGIFFLLLLSAFLINEKDLRYILIITLLASMFIILEPLNKIFLRVPFSLLLVFFIPGYVFVATLFPNRNISPQERVTLSITFSIVLIVFIGFVLNLTFGFRTTQIVLFTSLMILIFSINAALMRKRYTRTEKLNIPLTPNISIKSFNDMERVLLILFIISILITGAMLVYAKINTIPEKFTVFYILGERDKAEAYTKSFYYEDPQLITVGIENYEGEKTNYKLEVRLNNVFVKEESFSLGKDEKLIKDVSFVPNHVGDRMKLEFLLYKNNNPNPYRSTHLWVYSDVNYGDSLSLLKNSLKDLPVIENFDFDLRNTGWTFEKTNNNFSSLISNDTYVSQPYSKMLYIPSWSHAVEGDYASITQEVSSETGGATLLSFNVLDDYDTALGGIYLKQVLVNGIIVWEKDANRREGWEFYMKPVSFMEGKNKIEFRVYKNKNYWRPYPIKVWWDNIKIHSISDLVVL